MNTLLLVFPKIILLSLLLQRYPSSPVQTHSLSFSPDEKAEIIALSETLYLQIPDDSQFVITEEMPHQAALAELSALFLVEKDLLKTLSRKIHRSQGEWDDLLRRMTETYDEISRLMAVMYPASSFQSCENTFTRCLRQCQNHYCTCIWEGLACKLELFLTDLPQTDRQAPAPAR